MKTNAVYHPRDPFVSPLWNLLNTHYDDFERCYEEKFERSYGFFRPIISEVVTDYLSCGDLQDGFARIKCKECGHEKLLAFSCRSRWFCPSCHSKKVVQFGAHLTGNILYPVPHRQYVFSIPIMLRVYFRYDRKLLSKLARCAYESILDFFRVVLKRDGIPGAVLAIQTFGEYPDRFHPHIHTILSDGLFTTSGMFYVMTKTNLCPLEEIFRENVFALLKAEGRISDELINKLRRWRYSGFNVHNGVRIKRDDGRGKEALGQYIIRNTFSVKKMTYNEDTGTVLYKSKMTHGNNKKNFKVYSAQEFIAGITQHIPDKSHQLVRYYGWYSNRSRGDRKKKGLSGHGDEHKEDTIEIIDVSDYQPKRIPSLTWRECIKRIWEVDPLLCPKCMGEMKIVSFITQKPVIDKILKYIQYSPSRGSPTPDIPPKSAENNSIYEPFYDDLIPYEEPVFSEN